MLLGALVGATAIGKTQLSLEVAQKLDAEIIVMDSRQVYQGFRIGTAQPTEVERNAIPHHLVDFLAPTEIYSAGAFLRDVQYLNDNNPTKRFILVGGTGLYLNAITEGLATLPSPDPQLRVELQKQENEKTGANLHRLSLLDPDALNIIDINNPLRVSRALEVSIQLGQPWSKAILDRTPYQPSLPVIWLSRSKEDLNHRIHARVIQMFQTGWIEEVRSLLTIYKETCPAMLSLGYREIAQICAGNGFFQDSVEQIVRQTQQYAKRQTTWFRNSVEKKEEILVENGEKIEISMVLNFFQKSL